MLVRTELEHTVIKQSHSALLRRRSTSGHLRRHRPCRDPASCGLQAVLWMGIIGNRLTEQVIYVSLSGAGE